MNAIQRLVGQKVINNDEADKGTMVLLLSDAVLSAYNPTSGATPGECIGATIMSVELIEGDNLNLAMSNGRTLHISLKDDDYTGPEAFSVRFKDGTIIVEQ